MTGIGKAILPEEVRMGDAPASDAGYLGNLIGRWREKETFKAEIYQKLTDYPFEDITLRGPQDYETYLTQMYGNYMQLPPEASRQAHAVEGVYWR